MINTEDMATLSVAATAWAPGVAVEWVAGTPWDQVLAVEWVEETPWAPVLAVAWVEETSSVPARVVLRLQWGWTAPWEEDRVTMNLT